VPDVPDPAPADLSGLSRYKQWKPDAQEAALELLKQRQQRPWRPFYCPVKGCNGHPHCLPVTNRDCAAPNGHEWELSSGKWGCAECGVGGKPFDKWLWEHARADQHPPKWSDDWLTFAMAGGRGSGKTRGGSEVTHKATELTPRIVLVAPTGPDFRDTMVEGRSGLLATAKPGHMPEWEPSKKQLTWPNGCIGKGYSAEEPDRLRGPESGYIWADEPAHYPDLQRVWDNMLYGHRIRDEKRGLDPKVVITSTPKPTKAFKAILNKPNTVLHRVSSYANRRNLAESFQKNVLAPHEGTRLGRQEIHGELLEDVEGALWSWDMFIWADDPPRDLKRIVVAVDPAGTANRRSDETGIIVVGIGFDHRLYVLHDATGKYSPHGWGTKVNTCHEQYAADAIVAENNYGKDMVTYVLENAGFKGARIIGVDSRRGKQIRAEPVVALYEKKRVIHVGARANGVEQTGLSRLEDEQTTWVPGEGASPNRVDALVHGITELAKNLMPARVGDPTTLADRYRNTGGSGITDPR